jgi:hypothetical protein
VPKATVENDLECNIYDHSEKQAANFFSIINTAQKGHKFVKQLKVSLRSTTAMLG